MPLPVTMRSKEWVCDLSFDGFAGSNPAGSVDVFLFRALRVGRQRCLRRPITRPEESTDCGGSNVCNREAS